MANGPEKLIFVGGAPRSGTTITHALLCTSASVCRYHPEISFFRGLPIAYRNGRVSWKQHTGALFPDPEQFRLTIRAAADVMIEPIWRTLEEKPILCVKDPHLTPHFPDLNLLYRDDAWFVVVARDPRDVVRSRQEVHAKEHPDRPFTLRDATAVASEYVRYYRAVLAHNFAGRLLMFRYEDLDTDRIKDALARFIGVGDLFARPLWGQGVAAADDPWGSPKYNRSIDLGRRLDPLEPEMAAAVMAACAPITQRFGYV